MMDATPRKRVKKKRRELAPLEPVDAACGPAMMLLNERQRLFVRALFEFPKKFGAATFAARSAGYGGPRHWIRPMSFERRLASAAANTYGG
jgi:hypothetical protein